MKQLISSKNGQAAVEFLTTYGWMFLIVIMVFGALAYFGFTDAKSNIPDSCNFDKTFKCNAYVINDTANYAIELSNIESKQLNITHVVCGYTFTDELVRYNFSDAAMQPGESRVYACNSTGLTNAPSVFTGKNLVKIKVIYEYIEAEPLPLVASGELFTESSDDAVLYAGYAASAQGSTQRTILTP